MLQRKGKLVEESDFVLQQHIIKLFHDSPLGGHSGVIVTTKKLACMFYLKHMRKDVRNSVRNCAIYQRCKPLLHPPTGTLQPLPIPEVVWVNISLDFVEGLPKSRGKNTILVIVDRLSKYAHFLALSHPFTAAEVTQVYFEQVFKLHGIPKTIVSDRDKIFISNFWTELFKFQQVALHKSTAYHPQTDG